MSRGVFVAFALVVSISVLAQQSQPPAPTPPKLGDAHQRKTGPKQTETGPNKQTALPPSAIPSKPSPPIAPGNQQEAGREGKDGALDKLIGNITNVLIALFTGALVWLGYVQSKAIHKQAEYMRHGLEITKVSSDAAKRSADVAERTLVATQRALVVHKEFDCQLFGGGPEEKAAVGFAVFPVFVNSGPTLARNVEGIVGKRVCPVNDLTHPHIPSLKPPTRPALLSPSVPMLESPRIT